MRPYSDWVKYTAERYDEALELLSKDNKFQRRDDISFIAAASAVTYQLLQEIATHEGEMKTHLKTVLGK